MKDRPAYLPLYVRDFLTDPNVLALPWLEQALYLRMLMLSWEMGPLPDSPSLIERMIGLGADQRIDAQDKNIAYVLDLCFEKGSDGWTNQRLEAERARWAALHEGWSEAGARGGRKAQANRRQAQARLQASVEASSTKPQAQAQAQDSIPPKAPPADAGSPPPPAAPAPARPRSKKPLWAGTIPDALQTPAFRDAWARWLAYRKEILKPVTQISGDQALAELATMGEARARAAIAYTIGRGWTGLREEERASGGHPGRPGPSLAPARGQEVWRADDGCPACGHANQPQATTCASCRRPLRRASPPHSLNGTH